jgi:hypothetical protein
MAHYYKLGAELVQGLRELAAAQENPATLAADYASARRIAHAVLGSVSPELEGGVEPSLRHELQELRADNDAYQARIASLEKELRRDRDATPPAHQQKIPDPPLFDGTRSKLRPFLAQLRLKVAGDLHRFPDAQHQLRYAAGRLEGIALDQVLPLIKDDNSIALPGLNALCRVLEDAFGDPDRRATAERQLERLRQANREFSLYFADFQRLIADVDWNDGAKRHSLERGLSTELKDALVTLDLPESFPEFAALLQRLDNRIRARSAERHGSRTPGYRPVASGGPGVRTQPAQGNPDPPPITVQHDHVPMDTSSLRRRLAPEERARRIAEGRCLYCGGQGHMARECGAKPENH